MTETKQRASLASISQTDNTFAIVAMDQRNTLKRMYAAVGAPPPSDQELIESKADVVAGLRGSASAFLLDPTFGVPALDLIGGKRPGVLLAAEPTERASWEGEPRASRDPSLNAAWVIENRSDALKFFIQLRPGRARAKGTPDLVAEALTVVAAVIADARDAGVPSVIENLIYPIPGEEMLTDRQREDEIIEAGRLLDALGPDLLKLEYPGSPAACRRLADSILSPWAVLSAGVAFDEFTHVLKVSCDDGGASGFIAGRALWRETVGLDHDARLAYLADEGIRRLDTCVEAISGRARPWTERKQK
ncbi:MAG: hypothetical protein H7146_12735 [Burkholderiaceae bacterium]|nr:hypothetical protein [Microbacteriaceae bacterium]